LCFFQEKGRSLHDYMSYAFIGPCATSFGDKLKRNAEKAMCKTNRQRGWP
jgi:hypothetical protein